MDVLRLLKLFIILLLLVSCGDKEEQSSETKAGAQTKENGQCCKLKNARFALYSDDRRRSDLDGGLGGDYTSDYAGQGDAERSRNSSENVQAKASPGKVIGTQWGYATGPGDCIDGTITTDYSKCNAEHSRMVMEHLGTGPGVAYDDSTRTRNGELETGYTTETENAGRDGNYKTSGSRTSTTTLR